MNIELFLIFTLISCILIFLGQYNYILLPIVGGILLFIIGAHMLAEPLSYTQGETILNEYTYLNETTGVVANITQTSTPQTQYFDSTVPGLPLDLNHLFGFILSITGLAISVVHMFRINSRKDPEGEE